MKWISGIEATVEGKIAKNNGRFAFNVWRNADRKRMRCVQAAGLDGELPKLEDGDKILIYQDAIVMNDIFASKIELLP